MKKIREMFWKYFVEKKIPMRPKLEEKKKFARMSWSVAPQNGDNMGYKLFGIINFFGYSIIIVLLSLFLTLILGVLIKKEFFGHLFYVLISVILGMGIAISMLRAIYEARYKLWLYVGGGVVNIIGLTIISYFFSLKYVVTVTIITSGLAISLYLFLTFSRSKNND